MSQTPQEKKNEAMLQDRFHHYKFSISWKSGSQVMKKSETNSLTLGLQALENVLAILFFMQLTNTNIHMNYSTLKAYIFTMTFSFCIWKNLM